MKECIVCGIEFQAKRDTAKFCSPKCRVTHSRSVTLTNENVTLSEPIVTLKPPTFKFTVVIGENNPDDVKQFKSKVREATYWYDVPLAAVPVYQKDWPKMPELMNGRQYFLWWKNEFKTEEDGTPQILNPFPVSDKPLVYLQAGENSRRWGTN